MKFNIDVNVSMTLNYDIQAATEEDAVKFVNNIMNEIARDDNKLCKNIKENYIAFSTSIPRVRKIKN